jgi:hypothetical protein
VITYRSDEAVSEWVLARIPGVERWMDRYITFGAECNGILLMGIVFDAFTGYDINMHTAIESPKIVTRSTIKAAFSLPFATLKCQRVTGLVPASNWGCRALCESLGFTLEGTKQRAFADDDELIYGMTREACRWL